jgi:hypothetical protein
VIFAFERSERDQSNARVSVDLACIASCFLALIHVCRPELSARLSIGSRIAGQASFGAPQDMQSSTTDSGNGFAVIS